MYEIIFIACLISDMRDCIRDKPVEIVSYNTPQQCMKDEMIQRVHYNRLHPKRLVVEAKCKPIKQKDM